MRYVQQMQAQSRAILALLGGNKAALEIVTDGLENAQLQMNMREEMDAGRCRTFQTYEKKLRDLVCRLAIPQPQPNPKAQNKQTKQKKSGALGHLGQPKSETFNIKKKYYKRKFQILAAPSAPVPHFCPSPAVTPAPLLLRLHANSRRGKNMQTPPPHLH